MDSRTRKGRHFTPILFTFLGNKNQNIGQQNIFVFNLAQIMGPEKDAKDVFVELVNCLQKTKISDRKFYRK